MLHEFEFLVRFIHFIFITKTTPVQGEVLWNFCLMPWWEGSSWAADQAHMWVTTDSRSLATLWIGGDLFQTWTEPDVKPATLIGPDRLYII
jgi:hypothetical protein